MWHQAAHFCEENLFLSRNPTQWSLWEALVCHHAVGTGNGAGASEYTEGIVLDPHGKHWVTSVFLAWRSPLAGQMTSKGSCVVACAETTSCCRAAQGVCDNTAWHLPWGRCWTQDLPLKFEQNQLQGSSATFQRMKKPQNLLKQMINVNISRMAEAWMTSVADQNCL